MKRRCPCGALVATWNYVRHRRGDSCKARPLPCPERCRCTRTWPCDRCELAALTAAGVSVPVAACILGIPLWRAKRELHTLRLALYGPKRIRRKRMTHVVND